MRRFCAGTPVHYEQTVREEGCGDSVRVHRYTMSKQSGRRDAAILRRYTGTLRANIQGGGMRRFCAGTQVHYEQTVREEGCGDSVRLHRYTMSKQSGRRDAAILRRYTGTL